MYAWIKQIATSNIMYPTVVRISIVSPKNELYHAAAQ